MSKDKFTSLEEALGHIAFLESTLQEMDTKLSEYKAKDFESLEGSLAAYVALGTVDSIKEALAKSEENTIELAKYLELGTVEELDDAITGMITFSESFKSVGNSVEEVIAALESSKTTLESYTSLGTVSDIKECLSAFEDATTKIITQRKELKEYRSYATLEDLKEIVESAEQEEKDEQVKTLAEKFDVTVEFSAEMLEKFGSVTEAEVMLSKFAGSLKKESNTPSSSAPKTLTIVDESTDPKQTTAGRLKNLLGVK